MSKNNYYFMPDKKHSNPTVQTHGSGFVKNTKTNHLSDHLLGYKPFLRTVYLRCHIESQCKFACLGSGMN